MEQESTGVVVQPVDKKKIRHIWRVALILAGVTAVEFIIAFTMLAGDLRTFFFILLTIVKAAYIVAEFMHLGHEKRSLKMSILLPMIFVIFLIFILWVQGNAIYEVLYP